MFILLCEEIRNEINGIKSIIGVFPPGGVKMPIPSIIPKFGIYVVTDIQDQNINKVTLEIINPKHETLVKFENLPAQSKPDSKRAVFSLNFSPLKLEHEGEYIVKVSTDSNISGQASLKVIQLAPPQPSLKK